MLSYWDRSIITDKIVDFNSPDTVLTEKKNSTGNRYSISLESQPFQKWGRENYKYENLALEIKNIWKLKHASIYPLVISVEGVVTKNS